MTDLCLPDIEIYVKNRSLEQLEHWLRHRCSWLDRSFSQGQVHEYGCILDGAVIPVLVHEHVVGKLWTSIWFKSDGTPWRRDLDCALEAADALGTQIRCQTSSRIGGLGNEQWWSVEAGRRERVQWLAA